MSHSVRITRTVTTVDTTSTLILNTGYLKTLPGLLKLVQLVSRSNLPFIACSIYRYLLPTNCAHIVAWCRLRWPGRLVLRGLQHSRCRRGAVLPADEHRISGGHLLSARVVSVLTQHGWHHLENHLRKCGCKESPIYMSHHQMIFTLRAC